MPVGTLPPCPKPLGKTAMLGGKPLGGCPACGKPLGGCGCVCCVPVWKDCFPGVNPGAFMVDFATDAGAISVVLNRQNDFAPVTFAATMPPWTGTPLDLGPILYNTVPVYPNQEFILRPQCIWQSAPVDSIPGYGPGVFYLFGGGWPAGPQTWVTLLWLYPNPTLGSPVLYSGVSRINCTNPGVGLGPIFDPTAHNDSWLNAFPMVDVYPA